MEGRESGRQSQRITAMTTWACWAPRSAFDDWLPKGTRTLTGREDLFIALILWLHYTEAFSPVEPWAGVRTAPGKSCNGRLSSASPSLSVSGRPLSELTNCLNLSSLRRRMLTNTAACRFAFRGGLIWVLAIKDHLLGLWFSAHTDPHLFTLHKEGKPGGAWLWGHEIQRVQVGSYF